MSIQSDHYSQHSSPLDQVDFMITEYESIKEPSPVLRYIRGRSRLYSSFCDLILHQISLIKSRPKAIKDGHVTIYDKCLVELCRNGEDKESLAGQEFYLREFMGIDTDSRLRGDVEETIDDALFVREELFSRSSRSREPEQSQDQGVKEESTAIIAKKNSTSASPSLGIPFSDTVFAAYAVEFHRDSTINTNIHRILLTYFRAKHDFYDRYEGNQHRYDPSLAETAKFLRDSAENALSYLEAQNMMSTCPEDLVTELQMVFDFAKSKAIAFLGGRKRRFEVESFYRESGHSITNNNSISETRFSKFARRRAVDRYSSRVAKNAGVRWHSRAR